MILVIERLSSESGLAQPGDYAITLLRSVVDGQVHSEVLHSYVTDPPNPPGEQQYLATAEVLAAADLNGDGRMEIVLRHQYYESSGASVHEIADDGTAAEVLSVDCGA